VLASAVVHATWNLWTKQLGPGVRQASLLWLLTAISSVCYAGFAAVTIAATHWRPDAATLGLIAGSGLIHVGYFFLLLRGYRVGDLSLVYPVARGTGPLLATGVAIAVYTLWDGWAVKRAGVPPLVFYWGGEVVRVLALSPLALRQPADMRALWRAQRWRVLGIALLSPLSYILILLALCRGDVGHIAPAREVSILFGAWRAPARRAGPAACWARGIAAGDSWRPRRSRWA